MSLATNLEYLMQLKQITPQELSDNTQIDRSTLTRILNNSTSKPRLETLHTLANYFNVDPNSLLNTEYTKELKINQTAKITGIREVLNQLMIQTGILNLSLLHKYTEVPISVLSDILNGKTEKPNLKTLLKLANFFNINILQLTGKEAISTSQLITISPSKKTVPLLQFSQIKRWLQTPQLENLNYINISRPSINEKAFAVQITTTSFEPDFLNQQILIIDIQKPETGDYIIATLNNDLLIFEYLVEDNKTYLRKVSDHELISIKNASIEIHGVIVQKIINMK